MGFYDDRVLPHVIDVVMNAKQVREIRQRVCSGLQGEVVEIGFGTGHNLPFLSAEVTRLQAVEPSQRSIALAQERIAAMKIPVEIVGLDGQHLPLEDDSADAVLCTWSLCTIPDPETAVREMARVLKPDGQLHFAEHGRAPHHGIRRWQDRLNGIQQRIGGGCNLNRDIPSIIEAAGMTITRLDTYYAKGIPKPYAFMYEGTATAG
ncbi:methyltransferase [Kocuria dechangensis]|uniref:Methyltransferase n=1 Tax=Kocuria dechangensis TaxID=1176249 RepID=A0A917HAP8_9MICC|nr:class I SAM-dependent methyltransferase [Kocuria dechangensis]GGG71970.1 methyltransferase [Kocuria dechangensis]